MKIKTIIAREILDSRGNPTLETTVTLQSGVSAKASVPSGASTGVHEALELRDNDKKRYNGKGVLKARRNVNAKISELLRGINVTKQKEIDQKMIKLDGTENKSKLGANAILSVSLACARCAALATGLPLFKYLNQIYNLKSTIYNLPYPMMNILNGGAHADWALDIQEFMVVPQQRRFSERVRCGAEIFHALKKILKEKNYSVGVGDEGGYMPRLKKNREAFELILAAIKLAKYKAGKDVFLAIDAAASEFFNEKKKVYELKLDKKVLKDSELQKTYLEWIKKYPLISLEDPFAEDDWDSWQEFMKIAHPHLNPPSPKGRRMEGVLIVGDDLFTTNVKRLKTGIALGAANAILIKLNQIGTLSETIDCIKLAKKSGYKIIISHRSGETDDTFIADLAVAINADFIKTGSLSRMERVTKYNRLMEIELENKK